MFLKFPKLVSEGESPYDCLVNTQRIMWADPIFFEDSGYTGTRLYMNVAASNGQPAQLDIDVSFKNFVKELEKADDHDRGRSQDTD